MAATSCHMLRIFALLLVAAHGVRKVQQRENSTSDLQVFGSGNDVCEPEKGWLWDSPKWSDEKLAKRFLYKQDMTLALAKWIDQKHCIFGFKGMKSCMNEWFKLATRVRKFVSCAKVPRDDGTKLSALVWGEGENNLKDFMQQVLNHMSAGFNQNSHVKDWLKAGGCSFKFEGVKASTQKHMVTMISEDSDAIAEAITDDVFGDECDYKKVTGLKTYRKKLKKSIRKTIDEAREGNITATTNRETGRTIKFEDFTIDVDEDGDDEGLSLAQQLEDLAGSFAEVGTDAVARGDVVRVLLWILLICLTGPIGVIIMLIVFLTTGNI
jgi:hypothetical protein